MYFNMDILITTHDDVMITTNIHSIVNLYTLHMILFVFCFLFSLKKNVVSRQLLSIFYALIYACWSRSILPPRPL